MPTLNRLWAGRVYGTNTGNIFIEFTETDPKIAGIVRFRDEALGVVMYSVTGTLDGVLRLSERRPSLRAEKEQRPTRARPDASQRPDPPRPFRSAPEGREQNLRE